MIKLILKRLTIAIPTLIIIIAFVFGLMRLAPGGPFTNERALPPEIEQKIKWIKKRDHLLLEDIENRIQNQGIITPIKQHVKDLVE